jgi:hypothetical protein
MHHHVLYRRTWSCRFCSYSFSLFINLLDISAGYFLVLPIQVLYELGHHNSSVFVVLVLFHLYYVLLVLNLLIPIIIQILSSSKTKSARMGDPTGPSKTVQQLKMHSANGSVHAPVKTDILKLSQSGSFQILNREQNGTLLTSKDSTNPVSPPATSVSVEPQKKTVLSQNVKSTTRELSMPLQGPCGDKKSNARDKLRFFESLRTKSSNVSSTTLETVDVKHDSSLDIGNNQSLFPTVTKCMGNGRCFCEEVNSSEGSQRHLPDNEENSSPMKTDAADGASQLEKREADSSSEPADTGDEEFQLFLSDSGAEGSSFSAPADWDDGFNRSQSVSEEASSSSEATEPEDDEDPAEPPPEDKPFLISLGWREDEVVQPLGLEEIADTVSLFYILNFCQMFFPSDH